MIFFLLEVVRLPKREFSEENWKNSHDSILANKVPPYM